MCVCIHVCVRVRACRYVFVCVCIHDCVQVYDCIVGSGCVCLCMYTYLHFCLCLCAYVGLSVYVNDIYHRGENTLRKYVKVRVSVHVRM